MSESNYHVFLAMPNAGAIMPCALSASHGSSRKHKVSVCPLQFGDIEHNFNMMLCECVRNREANGITHFAMLHSDIGCVDGWLDTLIEEMDQVDADVMSTVIPIKDSRGVSTTGVRYPNGWGTERLTMHEIMRLPETFCFADLDRTEGHLAINTGLWTARIDALIRTRFTGFIAKHKITWAEETVGDKTVTVPTAWFDSEDWLFSDFANEHNLKVYATRKVRAFHRGANDFPNDSPWGQWPTEQQAPPRPVDERITVLPKPNITIEAEKPIATDSLDHTQPLGAAFDNSVSARFNRRLFELIPAHKVRLLDIGCAGGGLVRTVLEAGGFAVGIEGSDFPRINKRGEWSVIPDWLFNADVTRPFTLRNCVSPDPLKFNVITGWEFLEHLAEEDLDATLTNILRHCSPGAIFIGSISQSVEPHHRNPKPKAWWIERLREHYDPTIEAFFGDCLVRGKADPNAESFSFGMRLATV